MGVPRLVAIVCVCLLTLPFVNADLLEDATGAEQRVREFTSNYADISEIVVGDYATVVEKLAVDSARKRSPVLDDKQVFNESAVSLEALSGTVILIGGPTHNSISAQIRAGRHTTETIPLMLGFVELIEYDGRKAVIISDRGGYENLPRTNVVTSPLARFMPLGFIPVAASLIILTLIWLWNLLTKMVGEMSKGLVSKRILKFATKKPIKIDFVGFHLRGMRVKVREWFAIGVSAIVFAAAISYSYYVSRPDIIAFILLTAGANLVMYTVKHIVRLIVDVKRKLHTEYSLWYFGLVLTLISGWLGNVFAVAGYTRSEGDARLEGLTEYLTALIMFVLFIITAVANFLSPSVFLQMVWILAITSAFLSLLPMHPYDGRKIFSWNKAAWWGTFVPVAIAYGLAVLVV